MSFESLAKHTWPRAALYRLATWRVQEKLPELRRYLDRRDRILDIGAGNCVLCQALQREQFRVTALDVRDVSFVDGLTPILYDGVHMPFEDEQFDTAMLVTVLHHTANPDQLIREARRVARSLIIIEEVYENVIEKNLTFFIDSVFNLEFVGHPHTNRSDAEWMQTFNRLGLHVNDVRYRRSVVVMRRATYYLTC